jgi:bacterioferritin (cytochrome b1)
MDKLRDLLIEAINQEWHSYAQYITHASLIETMGKSARVEHLNEHADEEKDHAERLTMHVLARGPAFNIDFSCVIPEKQLSGDVVSMLIDDLNGEVEIIQLYLEIIDLIGEDNELRDTRLLIEDIIADEIEHQDDLTMIIKNRLKGQQNAPDPDEQTEEIVLSTAEKLIKCANKLDNIGMIYEANNLDQFIQEFLGES